MAAETKPATETPVEVSVSDGHATETAETPAIVEKKSEAEAEVEVLSQAQVEAVEEKTEESDAAAAEIVKEEKITSSASFKEETNVVEELPDPEKKALDELKLLVREALDKHEFTSPPPPPPPVKSEEKKPAEESKTEEKKEAEAEELKAEEKKPESESALVPPPASVEEPKIEEKKEAKVEPKAAEKKEAETEKKPEEKKEVESESVVETPPPPPEAESSEPAKVIKEATETVEEVKETIVEVVPAEVETTAAPPPPTEDPTVVEETPLSPEEISIWGIPLLADERSDTILLKFLRARDFKVKDAFTMLKSVVAWRKEFEIEKTLEEESVTSGLEKVVFLHGVDKEGHPVCYNAYGEFQDKELYQNVFSDAEKQSKFLKWRIQFLEKSISKLDFNPDGICSFVQVNDLKNSPGLYLFKKELRQATNQALQLLQDNYPEFVAKQVFINVPWWYVTYNRMISPFLTARTKSKFVFVGPSKTTDALFKYIAPEQVPVQYGGLSSVGEHEFSPADAATEETIKPTSKHTIEIPVTEGSTLVWEARILGWEVSYGAEFVPSVEGGYTVIIQKKKKIGPADEPVVSGSYKVVEPGKIVITFDNQTSKKKKLLYRSKTKPEDA